MPPETVLGGGSPMREMPSLQQLRRFPEPLYRQQDSASPSILHAPKPDWPPRSISGRPGSPDYPGVGSRTLSDLLSADPCKPPAVGASTPHLREARRAENLTRLDFWVRVTRSSRAPCG